MNAFIIIGVHFVGEDAVAFTDPGDVVADASSDEMILDPAVRSLDFALRLRGQGVNGFDIEVADHLPPLGVSFIGEKMMLVKKFIPASDESENGVGVDVKGIGDAVFQNESL